MLDAPDQPVAGSLSAKVIRACPEHVQCALERPKRTVEDLGTIAHFDHNKEDPWRRHLFLP